LFDNCNKEQIGRLYEMFFNKELSELNKYQLKQVTKKYSPAEITSIFLRYRNNPDCALLYLYQDEEENETKEHECSGNDCYDGINVPAIYALTNR
jgi:hypothetical protein